MYLKRLTARGFKSFASATTLTFEPGITCIVGPNGSGKSNVADALAWVMGEQGPKTLRGGSMEDVIFAGTAGRPALGRAEVSLTIDNSDHALPIDFAEVTLTRTKFRNGNSEYAINGTPARLLDVRDLLSDSGIGREMHVIVGQGQLDQILNATPEVRRGLVEEAAGILKHRERKEKALRKLDATQANLHRLTDLVGEIGRQLKPLGRQAEIAQRAAGIQADLRDAKARLLADDWVQADQAISADLASEADLADQRRRVEQGLAEARRIEDSARATASQADTAHRAIQETWFALSSVADRIRSTVALAEDRVRQADLPADQVNPARDPDTLLAQAEDLSRQEDQLNQAVASRAETLATATAGLEAALAHQRQVEAEYAVAARQVAERRETSARLTGQLASLTARVAASRAQLDDLTGRVEAANARAEAAEAALADLPGDADDDRQDLLDQRAGAERAVEQAAGLVEAAGRREQELARQLAGLESTIAALRLATTSGQDAAAWLGQAGDQAPGVLGPLTAAMTVTPGYETAIATALGAAAEALIGADLASSVETIGRLRRDDRGRVGLVVATAVAGSPPLADLPEGACYALSVVDSSQVMGALAQGLAQVVIVDDLAAGAALIAQRPDLTIVTRQGDVVTAWYLAGGSAPQPTGLELSATMAATERERSQVAAELDRATADLARAGDGADQARRRLVDIAAQADHLAAAQIERAKQVATARQGAVVARHDAQAATDRLATLRQGLARDQAGVADLEAQVAGLESAEGPAPDDQARHQAAAQVEAARAEEMAARLAWTSLRERVRSITGQAEAIRQTALAERDARSQAEARRRAVMAAARRAGVVVEAGGWLAERADRSVGLAEAERARLAELRTTAAAQADQARRDAQHLADQLAGIVDSAHRDELARTQQRLQLEALTQRALDEVGVDPAGLVDQYGPDRPVPLPDDPDQTEPYDREQQLKRLRRAEHDLQLLGRVNPLALEEYDALRERHQYLAQQLTDLKRARTDLLGVIDEVDARVREVFAAAYADVEREFTTVFERLFPGGQGRLILTEPSDWLTTGIEVEARPAGKKVKRLSLLSGGERSLVAICFLVALFKARPSPFYILDEVEAALDDTNLIRLLSIYEELRVTSQLLVITHQKRTMEAADILYGVTMGADGTSAVVSQRLRLD